ncbi:MAG: hypothetical protein M3P06_20420 [Acidobacteriota bacterium]|nr:hypothetical protein [Acidobacteriota bacterium]
MILAFAAFAPTEPDQVRPAVAAVCSATEKLGTTEPELRRALGALAARRETVVQNPHEPTQKDVRVDIEFKSASAVLYIVPAANRSFLAQFVLRRPLANLEVPIRIGAPLKAAREYLGVPDSEKPNALEYRCDYELGSTLRIGYTRGRVSSIEWHNWPD